MWMRVPLQMLRRERTVVKPHQSDGRKALWYLLRKTQRLVTSNCAIATQTLQFSRSVCLSGWARVWSVYSCLYQMETSTDQVAIHLTLCWTKLILSSVCHSVIPLQVHRIRGVGGRRVRQHGYITTFTVTPLSHQVQLQLWRTYPNWFFFNKRKVSIH